MSISPISILYDSSGNPVSIVEDSGVYRVSGLTKVLSASGSQINPATQETLLAADGRLTTIDAVLDSIKDTDGIKKIVDALPVGDNTLGRTKLTDGTNTVSLAQDGSNWRLMVDVRDGSATVCQHDYLKNGTAFDMRVDGDPTPVTFSFPAHATDDIVLSCVVICISATSLDFDGTAFGAGTELSNGILFQATVNGGIDIDIATININEDFLRLFTSETVLAQGGINDVLACKMTFGGQMILKAGTADKIQALVRDDLTGGALGLKHLTATVHGIKE